MAPIMYNPDLLEAGTVRRMFRDWQTLLEAAVANPEQSIKKPEEAPETAASKPTLAGRLKGWLKRTA